MIKRIKFGIIIFAVEVFFLYRSINHDLELFFMIWGFVFLAILIYNVFNIVSNGGVGAVMSNNQYGQSSSLHGLFIEKSMGGDSSNKRQGGGLLDPLNMVFALMVILNIVGYIIVMPK